MELMVGLMDTHPCLDTIRPEILMWALREKEEVTLGEGQHYRRKTQASDGIATDGWTEAFPFSRGGRTGGLETSGTAKRGRSLGLPKYYTGMEDEGKRGFQCASVGERKNCANHFVRQLFA